MHLQIISKETLQPSIWDGGKTYEYVIYPNISNYTNRDFDIRISSASIDKTPSSFTQFKGYNRYLVMLDNDLIVHRNGVAENYSKDEIFKFDSADTIQSYSLGNDFNVMVKKENDSLDLKIGQFNGNSTHAFIFAFAIEKVQLTINQMDIQLEKYDLVIIENEEKYSINCRSNQKIIIGFM